MRRSCATTRAADGGWRTSGTPADLMGPWPAAAGCWRRGNWMAASGAPCCCRALAHQAVMDGAVAGSRFGLLLHPA